MMVGWLEADSGPNQERRPLPTLTLLDQRRLCTALRSRMQPRMPRFSFIFSFMVLYQTPHSVHLFIELSMLITSVDRNRNKKKMATGLQPNPSSDSRQELS